MNKKKEFPFRRASGPAYAKINLYLDVLACRADGYHDLVTVMHTLALHDDVTVEVADAAETTVSMRVYGARLPLDERNLAYRAAAALLSEAGITATVHVNIRKKLPIAAGLAGGSSDAAATLRLLNGLLPSPLPAEQLLAVAARLGSDVPFCLAGGTRVCRGRGEIMTPVTLAKPLFAVVATGREHVSTPQAFAAMDEYYHRFDGSVAHGGDYDGLLSAMADGSLNGTDRFYNAFEPVILPGCPAAAELKDAMLAHGAYAAHMSGSGPAVFGLFRTWKEAAAAARALGPSARATHSTEGFSLD